MSENARYACRVVVALYLVYTGFNLVRKVWVERPSGMYGLIGFGVVFFIFGLYLLYRYGMFFVKQARGDFDEEDEEE